MYIANRKFAGRVKDIESENERIILDTIIKDGSRNAFVRPENKGKVWKVCNERLPEYALQKGCVPVVISADYGDFELYDKNGTIYKIISRHDPLLVKKARGDKQYAFEYIPYYMVNHYRIHEYDGAEWLELLVDKYKLDEITKITKNGQATESQMNAISHILTKNIQKL